jgi:hypothetical protein
LLPQIIVLLHQQSYKIHKKCMIVLKPFIDLVLIIESALFRCVAKWLNVKDFTVKKKEQGKNKRSNRIVKPL